MGLCIAGSGVPFTAQTHFFMGITYEQQRQGLHLSLPINTGS